MRDISLQKEATTRWRKANPARHAATTRKHWASLSPAEKKERNRTQWLRKRYQLTPEAVQAQLDKQGGLCGICTKPVSFDTRMTHVDHCHTTGKFRGILCQRCNVRLAALEDKPFVEAATRYLKETQQ